MKTSIQILFFGLIIFSSSVWSQGNLTESNIQPITIISSTGAKFVQDKSIAEFGNAYRDEATGIIWSELSNKDGSLYSVTLDEAKDYCKSKNASIPTLDEVEALSRRLGFQSSNGYRPSLPFLRANQEITPTNPENIIEIEDSKIGAPEDFGGFLVWADSSKLLPPVMSFVLDNRTGEVFDLPSAFNFYAVCVKRP